MVGRQQLEVFRNGYQVQYEAATAAMHQWAGVMNERKQRGDPPEQVRAAALELRKAENQAAFVDGAIRAVEHLLQECDLVEVEPLLTLEEMMEVES